MATGRAFPLFPKVFKRKNDGELSTELKDLDVDRVDGVDRPATGRAFAITKRVTDDAAAIAALLKQLYPSAKDIYRNLITQACDAHIVKMMDGKVLKGYIVKGDDVSSPMFPTLAAAIKFVTKVVMGEVHRAAGAPPLDDDEESNLSKPMPGAQAALDDPNVNASGQSLLDDEEKPTMWDRHTAKGPMLNGMRTLSTKSATRKPPRI